MASRALTVWSGHYPEPQKRGGSVPTFGRSDPVQTVFSSRRLAPKCLNAAVLISAYEEVENPKHPSGLIIDRIA